MDVFSDEAMAAVVPIVVYWLYSGMYMVLGQFMDGYRLHPQEHEDTKNSVSKTTVVKAVLFQQLVQLLSVVFITTLTGLSTATTSGSETESTSYLTVALQLAIAVLVFDGWQYAWHRFAHSNRYIYRHLHSWHHRLVVPYTFGALYGHPLEGLIADTLGGLAAFLASGMSPRVSILFFSLCNVKVVGNHCGFCMPFNMSFWNNAAYHDVHHQPRGSKHNFSQLFFVTWDKVFGTYMPYVVQDRPGGMLQARPITFNTGVPARKK